MKPSYLFILSLLFCPSIKSVAQDVPTVEKNQFKIDFLSPGITYEHGLSTNNSLFTELGLGLGYKYDDYFGSTFIAYPFVLAEFRHYYNFERRNRKGKNVSRNSGNYLGFNAIYNFEPITNQQQNFVGSTNLSALYGFQRTYKSGFNLGLQAGVGYSIAKSDDDGFFPYLRFTIGWVLGKKK
jgi:hypothetical protein